MSKQKLSEKLNALVLIYQNKTMRDLADEAAALEAENTHLWAKLESRDAKLLEVTAATDRLRTELADYEQHRKALCGQLDTQRLYVTSLEAELAAMKGEP